MTLAPAKYTKQKYAFTPMFCSVCERRFVFEPYIARNVCDGWDTYEDATCMKCAETPLANVGDATKMTTVGARYVEKMLHMVGVTDTTDIIQVDAVINLFIKYKEDILGKAR